MNLRINDFAQLLSVSALQRSLKNSSAQSMSTEVKQPPYKKAKLNRMSTVDCIWCNENGIISTEDISKNKHSECDCHKTASSLKASKCHELIRINNSGNCKSSLSTYKLLRNVQGSKPNLFQIDCKNGEIDFDSISFQEQLLDSLHEHGIIILRNLFSSEDINEARMDILAKYLSKYIQTNGNDTETLMKAQIIDSKTDKSPSLLNKAMHIIQNTESVANILENEKLFKLTSILLRSEHVMTTKYKWLRAVPPSKFTGLHFDSMYMGLGCKEMLSIWVPFGRIAPTNGSLIWCYASHRCSKWKAYLDSINYGDPTKLNKDGTKSGWITDNLADYFNEDCDLKNLSELKNKNHPLLWCTTDFEPGDVAIFGLKLIHQTLRNDTNCYRLSCDTRWQPLCQPLDPRLRACGISKVPKTG